MEIMYERVAGIDVGKKEIAVTVRIPGEGPGAPRVQKVRMFKTFYPVLAQMVAWLVENQVTHVVMESTGCTGVRCSTLCVSPTPASRFCW